MERRSPAVLTSPTTRKAGRDDKGVHRFAGPEAENIVKAKAETSWKFRGLYVHVQARNRQGFGWRGGVGDGCTKL